MEQYHPEYVLILSGDHIYKMDYEVMLDFHKENHADVTIATMPVPIEEASRFGIVIADENKKIMDFEEKPEKPRSNLASMGIYIFSWDTLKEALYAMKDQSGCDFGKHIIPYCHENGKRLFAYEYLSLIHIFCDRTGGKTKIICQRNGSQCVGYVVHARDVKRDFHQRLLSFHGGKACTGFLIECDVCRMERAAVAKTEGDHLRL